MSREGERVKPDLARRWSFNHVLLVLAVGAGALFARVSFASLERRIQRVVGAILSLLGFVQMVANSLPFYAVGNAAEATTRL